MTVAHWGIFGGIFAGSFLKNGLDEQIKMNKDLKQCKKEPQFSDDISEIERSFFQELLNSKGYNCKNIYIRNSDEGYAAYNAPRPFRSTIYIEQKMYGYPLERLLVLKNPFHNPVLFPKALLTYPTSFTFDNNPLNRHWNFNLLNRHKFCFYHELGHIEQNHSYKSVIAFPLALCGIHFGLKGLAYGARYMLFGARGLAKAAQHTPSIGKELLKISSVIAKVYLAFLSAQKYCRLLEQQADNSVPDDIDILKGGIKKFELSEKCSKAMLLHKLVNKNILPKLVNEKIKKLSQTPLGHSLYHLHQEHPSYK